MGIYTINNEKNKNLKKFKKFFFWFHIEVYQYLVIYGEFISIQTYDISHSSNDTDINTEENKNFEKFNIFFNFF